MEIASELLSKWHSSLSPSKLIRKVQVFLKGGIPTQRVSVARQILAPNAMRLFLGDWLRLTATLALCASLALLESSCHTTPIRSGIHLDRGTAEILGSPDIAFAVRSMQDNADAIKQGKLAGRLASDSEVRNLALELVEEYSKADARLRAIAAGKLIRFSDPIRPSNQRTERKLAKLSGATFDKGYIEHTLKQEQNQLKLYRKEAKSGKDPLIQSFASQRVPELRSAIEKLKALRMKFHSR